VKKLTAGATTIWSRAGEVLALRLTSPEYSAVIEWVPTERLAVVREARPDAFSVAVPRLVAPSRNVTVPVGTPPAGVEVVTVAVNVTPWATFEGFAEDARAVLVGALLTTMLKEVVPLPEDSSVTVTVTG
jgi:hypothetical protein